MSDGFIKYSSKIQFFQGIPLMDNIIISAKASKFSKAQYFQIHSSPTFVRINSGTNNIVTMDFSPLKGVTTQNKFRRNE